MKIGSWRNTGLGGGVDLGTTATIRSLVLQWETAYGKAYQIQTSPDATTWTTIYSTTTGTGGTETLTVNGTGRYVRLYGTARGTDYGYSLWEFKVYGTAAARPTPPLAAVSRWSGTLVAP